MFETFLSDDKHVFCTGTYRGKVTAEYKMCQREFCSDPSEYKQELDRYRNRNYQPENADSKKKI